jgi:purine-binding chemotaxis protein CheW
VTRIASAPAFSRASSNLRGIIVPLVDLLRVKFGFADAAAAPVVIILNIGRRVIGVVVDAVSDVVALTREEIRETPDVGDRSLRASSAASRRWTAGCSSCSTSPAS